MAKLMLALSAMAFLLTIYAEFMQRKIENEILRLKTELVQLETLELQKELDRQKRNIANAA